MSALVYFVFGGSFVLLPSVCVVSCFLFYLFAAVFSPDIVVSFHAITINIYMCVAIA